MIKQGDLILWDFFIDYEGSGDMKVYRALKDFDAQAEKAKWEGKEYFFDFLEDSGFVEKVKCWTATEETMKFNRHRYDATISGGKIY